MSKTGVLQVLLLCILTTPSPIEAEQPGFNDIYINPDAGRDMEDCYTSNSSNTPCQTLNYAFKYRNNFTRYILHHNSTNRLTRSVTTFENLQMLAISGGGSVIVCEGEETGLAFVSVSNISFTDVTFLYCSATRDSTSKDFSDSEFKLYRFKVGLYFFLCDNVQMTRVNVSSSPGATGVLMYDTVGTNIIQESVFANNSLLSEKDGGGGGFYVEFTYCIPGDSQCRDGNNYTSNIGASYLFLSSRFSHNNATNKGTRSNSTYIVPYQSNHQAFGRGGGLSIFVKGKAEQNSIQIAGCLFEGNLAEWGGGLFVEFHDETNNNTVRVTNCTFVRNSCNYTLDMGTGGGGMRIGHYVYNYYHWKTSGSGNTVEMLDSDFSLNLAMYGGGLSISPTLQDTEYGKEALVRLQRVTFSENYGKFGAALHVGLFHLILRGISIFLTIRDCSFTSNRAHYAEVLHKSRGPYTIGVGAVYLNEVPAIFQGATVFHNNSGTALAVSGSRVDFTETHAVFSKNDGYRGGAIALLGDTYILIDNKTEVDFIDNVASDKGGAIYNRYIDMDDMITNSNCFIRHANPFISPDDWEALFVFANNLDLNGHRNNSIHTSSILPCSWAGGNGYAKNTSKIFCWKRWAYYDRANLSIIDCQSQISSEAGHISLKGSHDHTIQAIPGQQFSLPFYITDDTWNDITEQTAFSVTSNVSRSEYFWGGNATLTGEQGTDIDLTFQSLGDRIWHMELTAELLLCSPGLKPTDTACKCTDTYGGTVSCDPDTLTATIADHHWMGKIEGYEDYLVGGCPPGYCRATGTSFIKLPNSSHNLAAFICSDNREGVLCGECVEGYGPAVNSHIYKCVNCTNIDIAANIAWYIGSIYIPLAALFATLIVFDIRLTAGPANAFILYSQVVSSTFSLDADGQLPLNRLPGSVDSYKALLTSYNFIYGIFNLDFIENLLSPFCFSRNFNTLTVLLLDYGVAFFPLVMIMIVVVCLKLRECCPRYGRECIPTNRLSAKCLLWSRNINEALLPAFAAFILLSYTKLSLTSSYLIGSWNLIDENGTHANPARVYYAGKFTVATPSYTYAYFLPATFIFATFVSITPLLLLFYPLKAFEWCIFKIRFLRRFYPIDKVHVFLDTFQGCYKNKMRFFAGIYFLFRLAINIVYMSTRSWLQQFVCQQIACVIMVTLVAVCRPYNKENDIFNYVDTFIFADLAVLNALSLYMYTTSQNGQPPPLSAFVFQYVLVFLPLVYMVAYILWYVLAGRHKEQKRNSCLKIKSWFLKYKPSSYGFFTGSVNSGVVTRTELAVADLSVSLEASDDDHALFARAETTNKYRSLEPGAAGGDETDMLCVAKDSSSDYGTMALSSNPTLHPTGESEDL